MLTPPTTNDPALNRFLEEVASTIRDRVRPEEGWSLSDFASSVSEVISDKRDLIDIVTQYDNIEGLSEEIEAEIARLEREIQDSMDLLSSVNSKSTQFAEVMAWWDQNYTIIFDAQEALSIFQEIQGAMTEHKDLLSQTTAAKEAAEQAAAEAASAEEAVKAAAEAAKTSETNATDAAARASASETEVNEAREYVSAWHADLSPGGDIMTGLEWIEQTTSDHALEALAARDAAAASATAAAADADRAEAAAAGAGQVVSHQHSWGDVTGKPTVYPPESHSHPSTDISDSTSTGRSVLTASSQAAARGAIGAGTSNLAIGTTASTAKAGNYQPTTANITDATTVGRSVLKAADAAAARAVIGAGTSSLGLGSTSDTAAPGNHTHSQYAESSRVTALEGSQPIIVSSLPANPMPGRIYYVTGA